MTNQISSQSEQLNAFVNMLLSKPKKNQPKKVSSPQFRIPLSGQFSGQYLTRREAQCVYHTMQKLTIQKTAEKMNLSPRTIEFYLKRIRTKLNSQRKKDLINKLDRVNFDERYKQYSNLHH